MIKKSVFENDLINGMQKLLVNKDKFANINRLPEALDCLHAASEIFAEYGLYTQSDRIVALLNKLGNDPHTDGLTSEKMLDNLKDHGHEFNMTDDMTDVLDSDIGIVSGEFVDDTDDTDAMFEDE
jgi:hypothetical protein